MLSLVSHENFHSAIFFERETIWLILRGAQPFSFKTSGVF